VTVPVGGRILVNFPCWDDRAPFTVSEIRGGAVVPYPNARINRLGPAHAHDTLISLQSAAAGEEPALDPRHRGATLRHAGTGRRKAGRRRSGDEPGRQGSSTAQCRAADHLSERCHAGSVPGKRRRCLYSGILDQLTRRADRD
jgi:hypothetical protein